MEGLKSIHIDNCQLSDSDLVKRVLSGEKELYELLIRRNNQKLYRVIRSYLKELSEIEDIMQNTYLKAYEKLFQFKHESTFSTWLIRIGINEALARIKDKGKIHRLNDPSKTIESNTIIEMPDTNQPNPEKDIIRREMKQILEELIDSLEPKYKTVYILKEVEGMSIKEVSDCVGISQSNVKVRLHRAKNTLKEKSHALVLNKEIDVFEFGNSKCDRITERVMSKIL